MLSKLLNLYMVILIVRIVLTWVMPMRSPYQQPHRFLDTITEPVMEPFRRLLPPMGGIDLSPMILFIVLQLLISALASVGL